jgi:DNA-binding CsgD family transcriptional regulator
MDTDDTQKRRSSLVTGVALGGYAELYPSIGPRMMAAEQSDNPEVRKLMAGLHEALDRRATRQRDLLMSTWALTATEARLAMHLAEGGSVAGYAELCGVTVGTARSQLKSIFAKMGVNRQAGLVALVPRA